MMPRLALLSLLAACAPGLDPAAVPAARAPAARTSADRIAAECALLAEAARQMTAPHPGLREGCPGTQARDTRPLPDQMASLRAANAAALPPGLAPASRAETVFRRLITRGVPPAIAAQLAGTPEFAVASR